jgi:hypothetical protein
MQESNSLAPSASTLREFTIEKGDELVAVYSGSVANEPSRR